jgi:toxin ParE1/3/4
VLKLFWRESALDDLGAIVEYIGQQNLAAAHKLQAQIEGSAEALPNHPYIYRVGRVPGTREAVVHPNYILVYRVGEFAVEVVNVLHSRRQYPPQDT